MIGDFEKALADCKKLTKDDWIQLGFAALVIVLVLILGFMERE